MILDALVLANLSRKKEELAATTFCQIRRGHVEVLDQSVK